MLNDSHYLNQPFQFSEVEHRYGKNIHILSNPYLFTTMAKLGAPETKQPLINQHLNVLYNELLRIVVNAEFPRKVVPLETRMSGQHPEGRFMGEILASDTKVVCVNLARAGTVPSQICYDAFNYILNPDGVRQDHISINRKVDNAEKVVGTQLGGLKIGGSVEGAYIVVPDPMGATGSTIKSAFEIYSKHGKATKFLALHLVVTPEYLRMITKDHPDVIVYAIRLDRGLSPTDVLKTIPGTHWDKERGLNPKQYIVPGAGGLGEVINNAYV